MNNEYATKVMRLGEIYYEDERFQKAILCYDQLLEFDPEDPHSWFFRGSSKYFLNQYEVAIKDLDRAILLDPEYFDGWYFRGKVYILGKYEEAMKDLDRAIKLILSIVVVGIIEGKANIF